MTGVRTTNLKTFRAHCVEVKKIEHRIADARKRRRELIETYGAGTVDAREASRPLTMQMREDAQKLHDMWDKFFEDM
ncbi:hypothetical protein ACMATS_13830 [Streptoverticillium reticulum]|uniref:hypothetical protein n=1 Tax=Streptoverticillium reticulum TaxID=1433415 RepID=UPI0039BFDEEC